jgi:TonB family protein
MFKVLVARKQRRLWSPGTVTLSVGAHLLLVGGVLTASPGATPEPKEVVGDIWELREPVQPAPVEPDVPQPAVPSDPSEPVSVPGETMVLHAPTDVPTVIPTVDPNLRPITADQLTGIGRAGDHIGTPPLDRLPLTGNPNPDPPPLDDWIPPAEAADVLPALSNGAEVSRVLQRNYPRMLQDTGVEGEVTVEMIVDTNGRVRPGSARVVGATHDGFSAATLRAVEHFRFRPARIANSPIAVRVTLPVTWSITR